jgi:diaminopimelate decarboxylase/aspartate kinase
MAKGELMSTSIGSAYLNSVGLKSSWLDARSILQSKTSRRTTISQTYLSAVCDYEYNDESLSTVERLESDVVVTQGFIAKSSEGSTVLLGRGGSDTSAAYIASKIGAKRLEIWTSVPGMFSANPSQVPSARMLLNLDYEEAQELASSGAKVLHPRCIEPVRNSKIPLHIRWTDNPSTPSTEIGLTTSATPQVKAISTKKGIHVISMESMGMWQQVGYVADIFAVFKDHNLSVDLISTSESNVTVTLDASSNVLDEKMFDLLLNDLSKFCRPKRFGPCASLSLVGKQIRSILHKLGPVLSAFEDKQIYLMSQAASDLNLTFTISEEEVDKLLKSLHELLFSNVSGSKTFGKSWSELFTKDTAITNSNTEDPWWIEKREQLLNLHKNKGPLYVYNLDVVNNRIDNLKSLPAVTRINYAMKANPHTDVIKAVADKGLAFDCVSVNEMKHVLNIVPDLDPSRLLFTPNFASIKEYEEAYEMGAVVNLDSLHPLELHPESFKGKDIMVRLDPGVAKGHHKHVRTAGVQSKFGVDLGQLDKLIELSNVHGFNITGLHAHVGSGIKSAETWAETAARLAEYAEKIPTVKVLDVGGGFGIPEKPNDPVLDMNATAETFKKFSEAYPQYEIWLEPGRYIAAESGVLLAHVTQLKQKGSKNYVGIETGMNSLIRPSLYGSYHHIVNLSSYGNPLEMTADVVGPICESGDVLGHGRLLPKTKEGDTILISTAGAYGRVMSSNYNLREPAEEITIN